MADSMQYVQYIGSKPSKVVTFLSSKPAFNEGNNYIAILDPQEAGQLMRQCSDIFRVVSSPNVMRPQEVKSKTAKPPKPTMTRSAPASKKGVEELEEGKSLEGDGEEEGAEPKSEGPINQRIFAKNDGTPFNSVTSAQAQLPRIAKREGIDPDTLEVVQFADGIFIAPKEEEDED